MKTPARSAETGQSGWNMCSSTKTIIEPPSRTHPRDVSERSIEIVKPLWSVLVVRGSTRNSDAVISPSTLAQCRSGVIRHPTWAVRSRGVATGRRNGAPWAYHIWHKTCLPRSATTCAKRHKRPPSRFCCVNRPQSALYLFFARKRPLLYTQGMAGLLYLVATPTGTWKTSPTAPCGC